MARKKVAVTITSEIIVDTSWYDNSRVDAIKKLEEKNWPEWFMDNIKSQKVTVTPVKK